MHTILKVALGIAIAKGYHAIKDRIHYNKVMDRAAKKETESKFDWLASDKAWPMPKADEIIVCPECGHSLTICACDGPDIPEFVQRDQAIRRHPMDPGFRS